MLWLQQSVEKPMGDVVQYFVRDEFQSDGNPKFSHFHSFL